MSYKKNVIFVTIPATIDSLNGMAIEELDVAVVNNLKLQVHPASLIEVIILNHPIMSLVSRLLLGREFDRHFEN